MSAKQIDSLIDALLEAKSASQVIAARKALGRAYEEATRKQSRLVGTVETLQAGLADFLVIDSREAELGLRRYKQGSPLDKSHRAAERALFDSFGVVAPAEPADNACESMKWAVEQSIMRAEETASLQTEYDRGLTQ
jgi:hypothetical protein